MYIKLINLIKMNARPMVNFFDALKNCFGNYANFKGRIRRSEYWWFMLVINIVSALFIILLALYAGRVIGKYEIYYDYDYSHSPPRQIPHRYFTYDSRSTLALIILTVLHVSSIMLPVLSATVRRLHDVGKRGEYIFIGFVPFFGGLSLLVLLCFDSKPNSNKYGPSPKYGSSDLDKNTELNPLTNQMITDNNYETP